MADLTRKTANLTSTNTWKNADTTDTRSYFSASFQVVGGTQNVVNVRDTGEYTLKLTGLTNETVRFKHNGSTTDIIIFSYACNFSEPTDLTISFYANGYNPTVLNGIDITNIMMNTGSTALPYEPYGWVHSLRKQCSATETIQSGDTIYTNGQPISTYSIKGNTVQNGTPTLSNPVSVNGVGERTENLYNIATVVENTFIKASTTGTPLGSEISNSEWSCSDYIEVLPNTEYTVNYPKYIFATSAGLVFYTSKSVSSAIEGVTTGTQGSKTYTFTTPNNCNYVRFSWSNQNGNETMFVTGGTAKPYEPYGYKIPISTAQGSAVNYLGSIQSTRQIYKLELTGNEDWNISLGVFYLGTLTNDYLRSTGDITYTSTHYQPYQQQSSAGSVPDGYFGFGNSTAVQRLYVHDSNYSTTDAFKAYLQTQYAAGTPVTVWYVLATEETGIVNEPLMKIGDYFDSIANATAIPTADGANTVTIDTTVQPSEFTATWTGWHDSSIQEYQGGVGNQKFDYSQTEGLLLQQYINQEGQTVENTSYNMSYLIPVTPNATYMWNFGSTVQHRAPTVAFYDNNGNYISVATHGSTTAFSFDTPINCAYVRVPIYISTKTAAMLNGGSTALPYEDYQYGWV